MSLENMRLPTGFDALEPFVDRWAIKGANNRLQQRLNSQESERASFFNIGKDLVPPALELLDQKPLHELDEKEQRLMDLVLSLAHISLAVEIQRDHEPAHAESARHITINRATSDKDTNLCN
ncbi:MAG: hypothetical protein KDI33_00120 [Halioglobus sp.]|nr:hypothetical protein [Halioglobus sp.]